MSATPRSPIVARSRWLLLLFLGVAGPLILPVAAYVAGGRIVGPYAGARGLETYLGAIYADALRGGVLALAIVLGPLLVALAWSLRRSVLRRSAVATALDQQ
jgi:hypothetical protein